MAQSKPVPQQIISQTPNLGQAQGTQKVSGWQENSQPLYVQPQAHLTTESKVYKKEINSPQNIKQQVPVIFTDVNTN